MRRLALATILLVLSGLACGGAGADDPADPPRRPPPATPAEDPYQDIVLPPRHGATTQASVGAAAAHHPADVFDTTRGWLLALGIVLGAIFVSTRFGSAWECRRLGRGSGALQVVSRLNIAPKQQILLVRVGRRLVLVGNSGTQMNPLCEIGDPEEAALLLGQTAVERGIGHQFLQRRAGWRREAVR